MNHQMTRILSIFTIIILLAVSCSKEQKTPDKTDLPNFGNVDLNKIFDNKNIDLQDKDSIVATLENYYQSIWEGSDLSGGLLVAKGDQIIFERYRGFGRADSPKPIDEKTPLHVASVSKTLTAMAVLKLVEAGKIQLNQKLTTIFPQFPYPEVNVFHLLSQRSGLPKYEYSVQELKFKTDKKFITNNDVLELLITHKPELARPTDTGFMYCNTNFALLALIVEKVTKTSFPDAMQKMVFKPLKMEHSFVYQEKDSATATQSFYYKGNRLHPMDQLDLIYGDKNVYTTPRDLLQFSKAMYADNFLRKDLMDKVFVPYSNEKPGINNYGLGFRMKVFDNGEKLTYHNGWWHGSNAVFAHLLKSNVTIIALGNKFSRRVYTALSLSGLFENYPIEIEKFKKTMNPDRDTLKDINEVFGE